MSATEIQVRRLGIVSSRPFEEVFPELAAHTRDQILLLGVDRLDYTKGIPHRLRIFESLLEHHPHLRGRITLVQVGAPTRTVIARYAPERPALRTSALPALPSSPAPRSSPALRAA